MLRPPIDGSAGIAGGNFVRENTVKSIWKRGGAMHEGDVTGAQSSGDGAGFRMY